MVLTRSIGSTNPGVFRSSTLLVIRKVNYLQKFTRLRSNDLNRLTTSSRPDQGGVSTFGGTVRTGEYETVRPIRVPNPDIRVVVNCDRSCAPVPRSSSGGQGRKESREVGPVSTRVTPRQPSSSWTTDYERGELLSPEPFVLLSGDYGLPDSNSRTICPHHPPSLELPGVRGPW